MERFIFDEDTIAIIKENEITLPDESAVLNEVLKEASRLYKEFIENGKFFDVGYLYEFGRRYSQIKKVDDKTYQLIEDWLDDYTGNNDEVFRKIFEEYTEDYILSVLKHLNQNLDESILEELNLLLIVPEIIGEIECYDISKLD